MLFAENYASWQFVDMAKGEVASDVTLLVLNTF